jgi:hypothetical protein
MFFGAGFGQAINAVLQTDAGYFFNVALLMEMVWNALFRMSPEHRISVPEACVALLGYCVVCLILLTKKVRAYEVIR